MTAPAITEAIDAVVAAVEAIEPTIEPASRFRRFNEKAPFTTKMRRLFDVDFMGHPRDLSNEGQGVQTVGLSDRVARFELWLGYPVANAERALETTMAVDSELVMRALGRSAVWTGTPVRRCTITTTVNRDEQLGDQGEPGVLYLVATVNVQYRDTET